MNKKQATKNLISSIAISASKYLDMFNSARFECEHHTMNILTKEHKCFHNNIKTECDHTTCPLKGEK